MSSAPSPNVANVKSGMTYQSPALLGASSVVLNEAQTLGTVAWLMLHSQLHRGLAISQLETLYLPAIRTGQYVLGILNETAVFYTAWTKLSVQAEQNFLEQGPLSITPQSWQSGERVWLMDWIAPFGHSNQAVHDLKKLWATGIGRALYLPPNKNKEMRLIEIHGNAVSRREARTYFGNHSIAAPIPKRLITASAP